MDMHGLLKNPKTLNPACIKGGKLGGYSIGMFQRQAKSPFNILCLWDMANDKVYQMVILLAFEQWLTSLVKDNTDSSDSFIHRGERDGVTCDHQCGRDGVTCDQCESAVRTDGHM